MVTPERRKSSSAASRRVIDEILSIARSTQGRAVVFGGSRPHVSITKQVPELTEPYIRPMLSSIEHVVRSPFNRGRESPAFSEWLLRSQHTLATIRFTKG